MSDTDIVVEKGSPGLLGRPLLRLELELLTLALQETLSEDWVAPGGKCCPDVSHVLTDQPVLRPHHVGRLASLVLQVKQVEEVISSPDGSRPVPERRLTQPGPVLTGPTLRVQQSHHPAYVSAQPRLPLPPGVGEDEGVQRVGGEISVEHHGLPHAGVY